MGSILDKKSAIFYLYRKSFKNRVKKALRKPVTYIYIVLIILYFFSIFFSFNTSFDELFGYWSIERNSALTAILTICAFIFIPSNMISYSRRKGLVFRQSDIHFLFSAPVSPKRILVYAHIRTILIMLVLNMVMTVGGILWFDMPVWKMLVYFLFSVVIENILEGALMILCYGNERLNKQQMFLLQILMYAIIGIFVLIGILVYVREGASLASVVGYLHNPAIQMIPILGWYIAVLHLLFMEVTVVSIAGTVLFLVSVIVLAVMALRMKCTGEYYEDAIKFAEDYEVAQQKSKKGEVAFVGQKKKYGKANVSYKGGYAKALFYRQLLEYKKNKFFIFGPYTLLCLGVGIVLAILGYRGELEEYTPFIILGAMAYLTFVFASYAGKWGKELARPYTYLIPDTAFHKLWYATLMEHIRALVDGCLMTIPVAIVMRMSVIQTVLIIVVYVCMQACKLYAEVMVEAFLGNILGSVGKQFTRLFFEGLVILIGIIVAAAGTMLISLEAGLLLLVLTAGCMTGAMMIIASLNFERMESVDE